MSDVNFQRLARVQLLMAQAIDAASVGMSDAAQGVADANDRFNALINTLASHMVLPIFGGAVADATSIMNSFVPCYWPLSGRRISNPTANHVYNQDVMLQAGQIVGFGIYLLTPPGVSFTRSFSIEKNGTALTSIVYGAAESGFKTATGFPFSFVAGDRFGVASGWTGAGTPADSAGSWVTQIKYTWS